MSTSSELLIGDRIYSQRGLRLSTGQTLDWFLIVYSEAQMVNSKRKGTRTEHKARRLLEATGYTVLKAGGSLGSFDLVAYRATDVRFIQVKCNGYCSAAEREALQLEQVPENCSKEIWRFKDRIRDPLIERIG